MSLAYMEKLVKGPVAPQMAPAGIPPPYASAVFMRNLH